MTAPPPPPQRFEFHYTIVASGLPRVFPVVDITEDVAHGIRVGLQGVASITDVAAYEIVETRTEVEVPVSE